jgi:hypothetical protein
MMPETQPAAPAAPAGPLLPFFAAAYALTWACFITVAVAFRADTVLGGALILLGAYSPSIAALALTARAEGSAGVRALLSRVLRWRVAVRWYLFAAGYMVAIKLAVALVHRVLLGAWPRFGATPWYVIPFAIAFSTPFQAGEEIGWRGYALPRLAARFGLARASLLLGVVWALWHLPQFYIRGADSYGQSFVVYALSVVAISVALAWLYASTGGSLLLPMVLHSAVNNSKDIVPSALPGATNVFALQASPVAWLTLALLSACALPMLSRIRKLRL